MLSPEIVRLLHLVAHELRSPLSASTGYVRLLLDGRLGGPLSAPQQQVLEQLKTALGRVSAVVGQTSLLADTVELDERVPVFHAAALCFGALGSQGVDVQLSLPEDGDRAPLVSVSRGALDAALAATAAALARTYAAERAAPLVVAGDLRAGDTGPTAWLLAGRRDQLARLGEGPEASGSGDFDVWQGGLGLTLVRAALVVDACGGRMWALADAPRATLGLRFPVKESES